MPETLSASQVEVRGRKEVMNARNLEGVVPPEEQDIRYYVFEGHVFEGHRKPEPEGRGLCGQHNLSPGHEAHDLQFVIVEGELVA